MFKKKDRLYTRTACKFSIGMSIVGLIIGCWFLFSGINGEILFYSTLGLSRYEAQVGGSSQIFVLILGIAMLAGVTWDLYKPVLCISYMDVHGVDSVQFSEAKRWNEEMKRK